MRVIAHTMRGGRERRREEPSRGEIGRKDGEERGEEGGSAAEVEVEVPSFPFNAPLRSKRRMILL